MLMVYCIIDYLSNRNIGTLIADQFGWSYFGVSGKISFSLLLTKAIAVILKLVCDAPSAVRADCALFHPFGEALCMEIVSPKRLEVTSVVSADNAHLCHIYVWMENWLWHFRLFILYSTFICIDATMSPRQYT